MSFQALDESLQLAIYGCLSAIFVCWALGVIAKEYSWVDRAWSILPVGYVAFFASRTGFSDPRSILMTLLAFLWGARLTFNFARKGGYAPGGEDYRWAVLRARMSPWQWQLFHFGFVAGVQNIILLLLALPAWVAVRAAGNGAARPLGALDVVAAVLFVAFLIGETVADENQWRFHQEKKAKLARGETVDPPFCDRGLFRFSRHPNFFCEQALWWVFYLFGVAASGELINPSLIGPVVLTALFHGSTRFTEQITLSKYPAYADYQRRTSRLLPRPPRRA